MPLDEAALAFVPSRINEQALPRDYDSELPGCQAQPRLDCGSAADGMLITWQDPIVEEVRKARDEHAVRFDYDLKRIFADLKEQAKRSGQRYVTLPPRRPAETAQSK